MRAITLGQGELREKTRRHPCYFSGAGEKYARIHLPVAPACNIQCRYCCRLFDCQNESRPGVTSAVLSPSEAVDRFILAKERLPQLSVVGIAGPGDALANFEATRLTLNGIREVDKDIIFCLSTNGLALPEHAEELIELGVKHVTVTINAVDPEIGARIYSWVNYGGQRYQGREAAELLLLRQTEGLKILASLGALIKVNMVMIKDINDRHLPEVVKKVRSLGGLMANIMPLIPAQGSDLGDHPATLKREVEAMRNYCQSFLPQMRHCRQCRADAVGLLDHDLSAEFKSPATSKPSIPSFPNPVKANRNYRLAVTSRYGRAVDLHFGHSVKFLVFEGDGDTFEQAEDLISSRYCDGPADCQTEGRPDREEIIGLLEKCDGVITMRIGEPVRKQLENRGIAVFEDCGEIKEALARAAQILRMKEKGPLQGQAQPTEVLNAQNS